MATHPLFVNHSIAICWSSIFGIRPDRTLIRLSVWLGILFLARTFVVLPVLISGESIAPLLRAGQIVLINWDIKRGNLGARSI